MDTLKTKALLKSVGSIIILVGVVTLFLGGGEVHVLPILLLILGVIVRVLGHKLPLKPYYSVSPVIFCPFCGVRYPITLYTLGEFLCPHCGYSMK